jgi:ankyrin repeat protein
LVHREKSASLQVLKLAVFFVSNNVLGRKFEEANVQKFLERFRSRRFLECLLSIEGPTTQALSENLFRLAISAEDVVMAKTLMKLGINPNLQVLKDRAGKKVTPVQRACQLGNAELLSKLIAAGADVNQTLDEEPPILLAAGSKEDPADLLQQLVKSGADVNVQSKHSLTPLCVAASFVHEAAVRFLITSGADVNFCNPNGYTALMRVLASRGRQDMVFAIVHHLLRAGAHVKGVQTRDSDGRISTPLELSISCGIEVVQILLHHGAEATSHALLAAASAQRDDICQLLVGKGAPITRKVIEAAAQQKTEVGFTDFLIQRFGVNSGNASVLFTAAVSAGNDRLIGILEPRGATLENSSNTAEAVGAVIKRGDRRLSQMLFEPMSRHRALAIAHLSKRALTESIRQESHELTNLLLDAGAPLNRETLLAAIRKQDGDLTRRLLHSGSYPNRRAYAGGHDADLRSTITVLPAAVEWGNRDIIDELLSAGAVINAPGPDSLEQKHRSCCRG